MTVNHHPSLHNSNPSVRRVLVGLLVGAACLIGTPFAAPAQQSVFQSLVGEWNHLSSGHSVDVRDNGDVWATDRPLARVSGNVTEGGGNFAFEGKDALGNTYRCVYYITFLANNGMTNGGMLPTSEMFRVSMAFMGR
jgi:hypothetical protein